ncbi:hypothetical protein ACLMPM_22740 [Yersinia enterocolitica]|uniref:hypothetical protein n=1 Tax=Yersinia enterocolitica TaxID=630 RepID=UPI00398CA2CF
MKNNELNDSSKLALEVTMDLLGDHFLSIKNNRNGIFCSVCGSNEWDLHPSPTDKNKPVIVTLPIPDADGIGVWVFYLICKNCGGMKFVNANKVVKSLQERKKI